MRNEKCVKIPDGEPPSQIFSIAIDECREMLLFISDLNKAIDECREMLLFISDLNKAIDELIKKLNQSAEYAEKLQRDLLISKTTGTVAASVGTTLNIIGLILIPFTVGLSVPILCGTGTTLAVSGVATNIGSTIAEIPLTKNLKNEINKLLDDVVDTKANYDRKAKELYDTLQKCDSSEFQYVGEFLKLVRKEHIVSWLKAGHFHKDISVTPKGLSKGDHIFRRIETSPLLNHHGIYINENKVVEFVSGDSGVCFRTLNAFSEGQPLTRRDYRGNDLSAIQTEELVDRALRQPSLIEPYNLFTNNCEHFATSMKLDAAWSGQVDSALTITSTVCKNIPRPISLLIEGVESGSQITTALAAPKSIFSVFSGFSTPVLSGMAKAAMVLGPVSVALDITALVFEYKKENGSADICRETMKKLTNKKVEIESYFAQLERHTHLLGERRRTAKLFEEERNRLEAKRIKEQQIEEEEERKRLEVERTQQEQIQKRWKDNFGIKMVGFTILYFCQFLSSINL